MTNDSLDNLCINAIRFLSVDAIEKAKSGHPGTPMGAAPMAYALWDRHLKHDPADPKWPDRDRFVLSCGHASMLLYSLLYLTGYGLTVDDMKSFRQWGSRTPGHPEYGHTPGVETTTGPLGQGFANAVGMAIAERWLAGHYNRPGHDIVDHHTYVIASDGDLQEGVTSEAASLAGTLRLCKLVVLYDENGISIEGNTRIAFADDVARRFEAYGWRVIGPVNGMDVEAVDSSLRYARAEQTRPVLIICRTVIGFGSPNKAGTAATHGEPLGAEETALTRKHLKWPYEEPFYVPDEALAHLRQAQGRGSDQHAEWLERLDVYRRRYPGDAAALQQDLSGDLPEGWDKGLEDMFKGEVRPVATRDASGRVMNEIAKKVHALVGGAADLSPSTKTLLVGHGSYAFDEYSGHNLHFGVREHAMGAVAGGMALHGGLIPYTGTFLVFYDYMRPPVRLASLMGIRVIFVFTHDSIGLGQDGPTHQPIEQMVGLRAVPNLVTIRPADATEMAEAWRIAMERRGGPTALIMSRQNLPVLDRSVFEPASGVRRGGYVLSGGAATPDVIIIGTGSEVHIALDAAKQLERKEVAARVVSLPSWELFDSQPQEYRDSVLPPAVTRRVSIEAASTLGWERYVGREGTAVGLSSFGASAPAEVLYSELGLTPGRVVDEALKLMEGGKS